MSKVLVVNLKGDRPTVEEARRRLIEALRQAGDGGVEVLKIVHGYGSSGSGGALRDALRKSLRLRRKEGVVAEIIHGEAWDVFDDRARALLARYPELKRDQDLGRSNEGVTLVVLAAVKR